LAPGPSLTAQAAPGHDRRHWGETRIRRRSETVQSVIAKTEPQKNPATVELGRRGGKKGGKARAAALSPERRSEIARKASAARWAKRKA